MDNEVASLACEDGRRIHPLKTWPRYFEHILSCGKTFEIRRNDRNYQPGDELHLEEWDPTSGEYTGRAIVKRVGYILEGGRFGIEEGYVVMALGDGLEEATHVR